jgi:hypothetical protein
MSVELAVVIAVLVGAMIAVGGMWVGYRIAKLIQSVDRDQ